MNEQTPSNALPRPIEDLIKKLQALPPGSTYQEIEEGSIFYGGQTGTLGTSYRMAIDVCEGLQKESHTAP